ncbi:MAG: RluA family pseudouridine synthase [Eubacterium sp.]|nr:RluA family pseudouridine synthase [Eubacterium sp.]
MRIVSLIAEYPDEGERIDRYLAAQDLSLSRSYIQKIIADGGVLVNQEPVKASYRIRGEDTIQLSVPPDREPDIRPENIPLDILYEDDQLLVVNKPKNMVVHPAAGHMEHTLVNALLYHCRDSLSGINGVLRPGIVHRIDKDTTGALLVCKTDEAHRALAEQLAAHSITREYRAIAIGKIPEEYMTICGNIGRDPRDRKRMAVVPETSGKPAVTHVRVLKYLQGYTYIACRLETGRTHQIRVHLSHKGYPLLGDTLYGPKKAPVAHLEGQTLHAMTLGFTHPVTGRQVLCEAPLPAYFQKLLRIL